MSICTISAASSLKRRVNFQTISVLKKLLQSAAKGAKREMFTSQIFHTHVLRVLDADLE